MADLNQSAKPGRNWVRILIGRPTVVIVLSLLACMACPAGVVVLIATGGRYLDEVSATATAEVKAATPRPVPTTYTVTLVCDECAAAGMEINLWETADRQGLRTAGSVPSGTPATVFGRRVVDGNVMLRISAGGVVGWVSEAFAQR